MPQAVPSLVELSLEKLARTIHRNTSLCGLEEGLAAEVFERILRRGALTPKVLAMFQQTQHENLLRRIADLNIQHLPARNEPPRNRWLGS